MPLENIRNMAQSIEFVSGELNFFNFFLKNLTMFESDINVLIFIKWIFVQNKL